MGIKGKARGRQDAALKQAELDLARDIAEGRLQRFGAGMTIDDALSRLRGDAGSRFANDGVLWDVAAFDDPDEAMTISKVLNSHGIRSGVFHHKLVFKQSDIARILDDLGLSGHEPTESAAAAQGTERAALSSSERACTAPAADSSRADVEQAAAVAESITVEPQGERGVRRVSRFADAPAPSFPRDVDVDIDTDTDVRSRFELFAENEAAVEAIRRNAAVSAAPGRLVLSEADRSELLERIASMRDEGDVPALSSPLRVPESLSHLLGFNAPAVPKTFVGRFLKICLQLLLIYAVCLAGEHIADMIPLGIPGNIMSMGLLLAFLISGVIRMESISLAADFLLDHMAVFFIPAAVAIMGSFDLIAPNLLKLLFVCLVTTVLVFFATSFTVSTVMNLMARRATGGEDPSSEDPATKES